jgi:oxygen-independent coproporphyrinogen-3 oxidase
MSENVDLSLSLIEKFDIPVPRYTSYPMVPHWSSEYGISDHIKHLEDARYSDEPISFYLHIPFCYKRCFFCGCNVKITNSRSLTETYLDLLEKEIKTTVSHLGEDKKISQLHLGGGTPTHLEPKQLDALMDIIESYFSILPNAEQSIEVHPSVTTPEHLRTLRNRGFNRISMGVQDFDPNVQEKINRHQTYEETKEIIDEARSLHFLSVNADLIYGLPYQTKKGFADTIVKILTLRPDRLAVYSYAHLPTAIKHQSIFPIEVIPSGPDKMELFLEARNTLINSGYKQIGFDHFSLPEDDLHIAEKNGTLLRNFMGYTTQAGRDMVAVGFSSISDITGGYSQNSKNLPEYTNMIEKHGLSIVKGLHLSEQDLIHKEAIMKWMCQYIFDPKDMVDYYNKINQPEKITQILEQLDYWKSIGLVEHNVGLYKATALGKIFARIVASTFDTYIKSSVKVNIYSKAI